MPPKKKIINILSSHIKSLINQNKNLYKKVNSLQQKLNTNTATLNAQNNTLNDKVDSNNDTLTTQITKLTNPLITSIWNESTVNLSSILTENNQTINYGPISISSITGQYQLCNLQGSASAALLYMSSNYGESWDQTNIPYNPNVWGYSLALSGNGEYMTYCVSNNNMYVSSNSGTTWTYIPAPTSIVNINSLPVPPGTTLQQLVQETTITDQNSVAISHNGQYQTTISYSSNCIYCSTNYGSTWSMYYDTYLGNNAGGFSCNTMSTGGSGNHGKYQALTSFLTSKPYKVNDIQQQVNINGTEYPQFIIIPGGSIFISTNYGVSDSWRKVHDQVANESEGIPAITLTGLSWISISYSAISKYIAAVSNGYGGPTFPSSVYLTASGEYSSTNTTIYAPYIFDDAVLYPTNGGYIYISNNNGVAGSWNIITSMGIQMWESISVSESGQYMIATTQSNIVYVSSNYGVNWSESDSFNGSSNSLLISSNSEIYNAAISASSSSMCQSLAIYSDANAPTTNGSGAIYYSKT